MSNSTGSSEWQNLRLREVSITKSGVLSATSTVTSREGNVPFIKAKDIHLKTIFDTKEKLALDVIERYGAEIVPKQSLVIAVSGPTVGSIALLETEAIVDSKIFYAIINVDLAFPRYLFHYLWFKRKGMVKSSKYLERVSFGLFSKLIVPIPSIKVQIDIVKKLEKKLEVADLVVNKAKEELDELYKQKHDILKYYFKNIVVADGKEVVFKTHKISKIADCGTIQAGKTPNGSIRQYYGTEFPLFIPNDLQQGVNVVKAKINLSYRGMREARSIQPNSILVCYHGRNFGKAGIAKTTGACNSQLISITPSELFLPEYLYFQVISSPFQEQMKLMAKNLSMSKEQFKDIYVELETLEKQKEVVETLNKRFTDIYKRELELTRQLQKAELNINRFFLSTFG